MNASPVGRVYGGSREDARGYERNLVAGGISYLIHVFPYTCV